jgi:hypothetical protein
MSESLASIDAVSSHGVSPARSTSFTSAPRTMDNSASATSLCTTACSKGDQPSVFGCVWVDAEVRPRRHDVDIGVRGRRP